MIFTLWTGLHSRSSSPVCFISAFFSASETALTGASRASMLRLSKQGNRDARVVSSLFGMRERMIGALLLGNNIANIGASALATGIFTAWFGEVGVLYATGVMTVLVVIFAEVLPKTIAINAPDRVSLLVARPMKLMVYLLGPLLTIIEVFVRALMAILGIKIGANQPILSPTERLRGAVDLLHHEGKVEKQDRDMFGGLLDLRELQVSDVMVHRTEMVMINADLPPEELVREVLATEYTRIPLWRDKPENIIGVLHAKDLLRAIRASEGDIIEDRCRRPSRCRHGSCRRCVQSPNSSRRSAAARPTSRWWSMNTAKSKAW